MYTIARLPASSPSKYYNIDISKSLTQLRLKGDLCSTAWPNMVNRLFILHLIYSHIIIPSWCTSRFNKTHSIMQWRHLTFWFWLNHFNWIMMAEILCIEPRLNPSLGQPVLSNGTKGSFCKTNAWQEIHWRTKYWTTLLI